MDFWNVLQHFELILIDLFRSFNAWKNPILDRAHRCFCISFETVVNRELSFLTFRRCGWVSVLWHVRWFLILHRELSLLFFPLLRRFPALYFTFAGGWRFFTVAGGLLLWVERGWVSLWPPLQAGYRLVSGVADHLWILRFRFLADPYVSELFTFYSLRCCGRVWVSFFRCRVSGWPMWVTHIVFYACPPLWRSPGSWLPI